MTAFTHRDEQTGGFVRVQGAPTEPIPIIGAGAANLLIRRKVLQDPRMHLAPEYIDLAGRARSIREEGEAPAVFRMVHKPNGQVLLGEDIDFVHRAFELGYQCVYDPRSAMGHLKTTDLASINNTRKDHGGGS